MQEKEYLNRYTYLFYLQDILRNERLIFSIPENWEDKNDSYFIRLYKNKLKIKSLFALCFVEYKNASKNAEKYHHWKIYAGNNNGVCIQFDKKNLISQIESFDKKQIKHGDINYRNIGEIKDDIKQKKWDYKVLPFIKRKAFNDEKEYRFIYQSTDQIMYKTITIKRDCIENIFLNPWINKDEFNLIKNMINEIEGCDKITIKQSTCLEYDDWKKAGDNISKIIK